MQTNLTDPSFSFSSLNVSTVRRYKIPNTQLAIDFWHQAPSINREDVLMCLVEAFSQIFGAKPNDPIPGLSTFWYERNAFIHVQDLNPTVGRPHTYQDLANTLRGVGEYMTLYNAFFTTEFQMWDVNPATAPAKIGSGGVGKGLGSLATDAVSTGQATQSGTPACNSGNRHCVAR